MSATTKSTVGIDIYHLHFFVVCGSYTFVGYIAVLSEGVKCRIEILGSGEKFVSAGMIKVGFQALSDIFCLENLDYLLTLDDVSVRSVNTETVYSLITVVVSNIESPQQCVMIHTFLGGFNTTGTAVGTIKNTGYPKYQTVKLSATVLTAAHGFFNFFFDIVVVITNVLLGSMTGQMQ